MKTRFLPLLLALILALTCCLPASLAESGVSNEVNVPVLPRGIIEETDNNNMKLSIRLSPSTVAPGGTVGVTVALKNETGAAVTGATLRCQLPTGLEPVNTADPAYDAGENRFTWTADIEDLGSAVRSFSVTVPSDAAADTYEFIATAFVNGFDISQNATATVAGAADFELSIDADNKAPKPGGTVQYQVALKNIGNAEAAAGIELAAQVPVGMTLTDNGGGAWDEASRTIVWTLDAIPAGESAIRTFKAQIPGAATVGAPYTAGASVPGMQGLSASETVTVTNYSVSLGISASPTRARAGDTVVYTITVSNTGNMTAPGVVITNQVPSGMSVSGMSDNGSLSGSLITWPSIDLGAYTSVSRTFVGTIPSGASSGAVYTNTASAYGLTASAQVTVYADEPDLRIKKTVNNRTPEPGASVRYTITVTNRGGADAYDVTVIDTLPDDLEVIESSISGSGTYRPSSHRVVWTVDVPADDKVTLTFRVWVPDDAEDGDAYVNRAYIDEDSAKCTIVVTEDAVPKTGEASAPAGEAPVPAAWWKKFAPNWGAPETPAQDEPAPMPSPGDIPDEPLPEVQPAFQELYHKNNDLAGWLNVPGVADLPVLQTQDNDHYMNHNFDGREDQAGALFLDERNTLVPNDQHLLIYGHNMKSGAMFGTLSKYRDLNYLKANPVLSFQSVYDAEPTYYAVVAVLDASMDASHAEYLKIRRPNFDDEEDGKAFLASVQSFSYFDIPVAVDETDPLLTLVTCSYYQPNGRLLVVARPLREGETYEDVTSLMAGAAAKTPVRTAVQA